MLELLAHDPLRGQAETVAVEMHCAFEVVDGQGDQGDAGLHAARLRAAAMMPQNDAQETRMDERQQHITVARTRLAG